MGLGGMFLEELALTAGDGMALGLLGLILGFFVFFFVLTVIIYLYLSFAYFAIAKKAKLQTPGIAWIPYVGPLIVAYQKSKMHWWPWLLLIGFVIPVVNIFASIIFVVFIVIWHWKMFETINKPGWWSILMFIPVVGLILIGVAAWSKD